MHTQQSSDKSNRDRDRLLAEIRNQIEEEQIPLLHSKLGKYYAAPKLYYKIHEQEANIEYLVTPDLSDLAAEESLSFTPEQRARQFLLVKHKLFDLPDQQKFGSLLYLKHTLRSRMGTHCIFELRAGGNPIAENCFVVHLDHGGHVIMVASVYQPDMLQEVDPDASWSYEKPEERLEGLAKKLPSPARVRTESMLVPNYVNREYEPRLQVKLNNPRGKGFVLLYKDDGEYDKQYQTKAGAASGQMVLGRVYRDFWSPKVKPEDIAKVMERELETVMLRDLQSNLALVGRYAAVEDDIYGHDWTSLSSDSLLINIASLTSSWIDRMMAYYHVDLIQRHFRELGLEVLDEYPQFNPMHVVLDNKLKTQYDWNNERIYLRRLSKNYLCTDAREARIVYHEFVHAVTDALARLHRQDKKGNDNSRYRQILQAAAMDEGLADYFACSLAARNGVRRAYFYPFMGLVGEKIEWSEPRRLGTVTGEAREYNLGIAYNEDPKPDIEYRWGEQWGRYLWKLRCLFGAEVADTMIAHSIFFLTRWSTFGMGVLALMLADSLLFQGIHKSAILNAGKKAQDWVVYKVTS